MAYRQPVTSYSSLTHCLWERGSVNRLQWHLWHRAQNPPSMVGGTLVGTVMMAMMAFVLIIYIAILHYVLSLQSMLG